MFEKRFRITPCLLLLAGAVSPLFAGSLAWTWHQPLPQGNSLTTLAAGDDFLIAAGLQGTVLRSENGENWEHIDTGPDETFFSSAYGDGRILLGGNGVILSTQDGITWTEVLDTDGVIVQGIAYGEGTWVAVGRYFNQEESRTDSTVFRSFDGVEWERHDFEAGENFFVRDVAFGAGDRFVLTGSPPGALSSSVLVSTNSGQSWTPANDPLEFAGQSLTWNGANFAVAGANGGVAFSSDGLQWETRNADSPMALRHILYADGLWVAAGLSFQGNREPGLLYSTDGVEWEETVLPYANSTPTAILHFAGQFLTVGLDGATLKGNHPENLQPVANGLRRPLSGIAHNGARYVAVGGPPPPETRFSTNPIPGNTIGGEQTILTSTDLQTWTALETASDEPLFSITYGNGRFVAVGNNGTVLTSDDGLEWTARDSGTESNLTGVAYGNGYFVAVGRNLSYIGISPDGINWTEPDHVPAITEGLSDVVFADGRFVAVGSTRDGVLHTTNPLSWERVSGSFDEAILLSVTHGANGFVAAGFTSISSNAPFVLSSQNGIDWTQETIEGALPITAVTATPDGYLAAASFFDFSFGNTAFHTSTDGQVWTEVPAFPRPRLIWDFVVTGDGAVGVGDGGSIVSTSFTDPIIEQHPQSLSAFSGETVEFTVAASDPLGGELAYQWLFEGDAIVSDTRISGTESNTLRIENVHPDDAGEYRVVVGNAQGTVTSQAALLTVQALLRVSLDFDENTPGWGVTRFDSVQEAIDAAPADEASTLVVEPGVYFENLRLHGKPITLTGTDPRNAEIVASTVLDGSAQADSVIAIIDGEDNRTRIRGFTIRNGTPSGFNLRGGGIRIEHSTPVIEDNRILTNAGGDGSAGGGIFAMGTNLPDSEFLIIRRNEIRDNTAEIGGGIFLVHRYVKVSENLILDNSAYHEGGGIFAAEIQAGRGYLTQTAIFVEHCVLHGNRAANNPAAVLQRFGESDFVNNIVAENRAIAALDPLARPYGAYQTVMTEGNFSVRYNNFWQNAVEDRGAENLPFGQDGNIAFSPLFADPENFNFRLRSQAGRWDPAIEDWIIDVEHSPLIAAGAPNTDGSRPNLGAYGLSETASLAPEQSVVSIAAVSPGDLARSQELPLQVVLGRTGSLDEALAFELSAGGDAEAGIDFTEETLPAGFSPGQAALTFEIAPLPIESVRGHRQRIYSLEPSEAFLPGNENTAIINLWDHPYHDWVATHFSPGEWEDPQRVGPEATPGQTGLTNLHRAAFAIGLEPSQRDRLPQVSEVGESVGEDAIRKIRIQFTRPAPHNGFEYSLEAAESLPHWSPAEPLTVTVEPLEAENAERVTWEYESSSQSFFRIRTRSTGNLYLFP